ncbi:MAG TPA: hypothetical protein VK513_07360 [Terriglobales bacterium]|jgi:hypothetical protein|nr:hypothetical protein [Terriglobales bacterium]HMJ21708.1 hypothetical protein [Terriglobales bacterium]
MQKQGESRPDSGSQQAAEHVAGAHNLLKALRDKIGEHPEIGQAINKLEMALAILEVKTGGMF